MKNILLLLVLTLLSSCSAFNTDFLKSKTKAQIEEKSTHSGFIEPISQGDVSSTWQDNSGAKSTNTSTPKLSPIAQKAVTKLKNDGVSFVLYFPFDDADISEANTKSIIKHANFMRNNPSIALRLEGHADERGTREYNLALGENRALSVKDILSLYEGLTNRIEIISFGEENPISKLHNEEGWQQNRRVEFIYR